MDRLRRVVAALLLLGTALLGSPPGAGATVFGTVRGVVHDPQHRPVENAKVVLKEIGSESTQTAQTGPDGEFHFDAVPLGQYSVEVSRKFFTTEVRAVTMLSGTAPVLHFQ